MFCFFHLRTLLAPAVLAMLLVTAPTLAQEEIDFIDAPQAADLDGPSVSSRREQPPQALDASGAKAIEDADFDYSFDGPSTQKYSTQKSCGCNECGGDSCGCDDGCRSGCDLFGCLRRMMPNSWFPRLIHLFRSRGIHIGTSRMYSSYSSPKRASNSLSS